MQIESPIHWLRASALGVALASVGLFALWNTSRPNEDQQVAQNSLPIISCSAMGRLEQLDKQFGKLRASEEVGGMGRFQYEISYPPHPFDEQAEKQVVHPNTAMPAFGGWLLGADRGEFGGELVFQPDEPASSSQVVVFQNIEDIYRLPFGFIATSGLAHMSSDTGSVLFIEQSGDSVTAKTLFVLPAAPSSSWPLKSNDVLINTSAGSFVVTNDRQLKPVSCQQGTEDGT